MKKVNGKEFYLDLALKYPFRLKREKAVYYLAHHEKFKYTVIGPMFGVSPTRVQQLSEKYRRKRTEVFFGKNYYQEKPLIEMDKKAFLKQKRDLAQIRLSRDRTTGNDK